MSSHAGVSLPVVLARMVSLYGALMFIQSGQECKMDGDADPVRRKHLYCLNLKIRITRRHYCEQHKAPSRIPAEILSILIPASHLLNPQKMKNQKLQQKLIKIEVRIKVPGPFY